jgi:signal-transduction protein with cAMP-binding, CBS, and nucleotidyltransferase domain
MRLILAVFSRCLQAHGHIDLQRKLDFLRSIHCLRRIIDTDLVTLSYNLSTLYFGPKSTVCRHGQTSNHVYFVYKGSVVLQKHHSYVGVWCGGLPSFRIV